MPKTWRAAWHAKRACLSASRPPVLPGLALQLAQQVQDATIVFIVCDRGERYLSTGVFPA